MMRLQSDLMQLLAEKEEMEKAQLELKDEYDHLTKQYVSLHFQNLPLAECSGALLGSSVCVYVCICVWGCACYIWACLCYRTT